MATRADSNDKRRFVGVRIFHSIYRQKTINLRVSSYLCELRRACSYILGFARLMPVGILVVIRTALTLVLIYSDSPRPVIRKAVHSRGFNRVSAAHRGPDGLELTPVFRQHTQIRPQYTETYTIPNFAESIGVENVSSSTYMYRDKY